MATDVGGVKGDVTLDVDQLKKAQVTVTRSFGDMQDAADKADRSMRDVGDTSDQTASQATSLGDILGGHLAAEGIMAVAETGKEAVVQLTEMTASMSRQVSESQRLGRTLGTSTQTVMELRHALTQMGVEGDAITELFATISERQQQALDGSEDLEAQWEKLGVSMSDLEGASPAEILTEIERGMRRAEDPTQRLAAASEILGDEFAKKLVNRMSEGEKSLADYRKEARRLGIAMSDDMIADFEAAERSLKRFEATSEALKRQVAAELAPALEEGADSASDFAQISTGVSQAWDDVTRGIDPDMLDKIKFGPLADGVELLDQTLGGAAEAVGVYQRHQAAARQGSDKWTEALRGVSSGLGEIRDGARSATGAVDKAMERLVELSERAGKRAREHMKSSVRGMKADIAELEAQKIGLDDALKVAQTESRIKSLRSQIKEMKADMAAASGEPQRARRLRAEAQGLRAQGRQEVGRVQGRRGGRRAARGVAGRAQQVADQAARRGAQSAVSAAMGATEQARQQGGQRAQQQARIEQTRFNRNIAQAKSAWQEHTAAAKKASGGAERAEKAQGRTLQGTQQLTGELGSLTTTLTDAAGAGRDATQAIGGVSGALQSVLGGAASGSPFGLAAGIVGGAEDLISGFADSRQQQQEDEDDEQDTESQRRKRDRRLAKWIAEENAKALEMDRPDTIIVSQDPRSQEFRPRGLSQSQVRELNRRLDRERDLNPNSL